MNVIITGCVLLVCTIFDVKLRIIPNYITVPFFLGGCIYTFLTFGIIGIGYSAINVLIIVMIFGYGFVKKYMGGGDIKLLLALSFWMNLESMVLFILATLVAGAIISIFKMIIHVKEEQDIQSIDVNRINPDLLLKRLSERSGKKIAYAVPILLGYLLMHFFQCVK
jgi:prepilin peptidase CpaA